MIHQLIISCLCASTQVLCKRFYANLCKSEFFVEKRYLGTYNNDIHLKDSSLCPQRDTIKSKSILPKANVPLIGQKLFIVPLIGFSASVFPKSSVLHVCPIAGDATLTISILQMH